MAAFAFVDLLPLQSEKFLFGEVQKLDYESSAELLFLGRLGDDIVCAPGGALCWMGSHKC